MRARERWGRREVRKGEERMSRRKRRVRKNTRPACIVEREESDT